jgi:hypothetical protein
VQLKIRLLLSLNITFDGISIVIKQTETFQMKKTTLSILIAVFVLATIVSCKKAAKALFPGAEFDLPETVVPVPPIPFVLPFEVGLDTITQRINLDSIVRANTGNNFGAGDISSVTLQSIKFRITDSLADDNNNFSNFESARFTLTSNSNSTPVEVANITFPTTRTDAVTYTPSNPIELRSYLDGNELKYIVYGKIRKVTTKELRIAINVKMRMR